MLFKEDDEEAGQQKKDWKHYLKDPSIILIIIGLLFALLTGRLGEVTYDKALVISMFLFVLAIIVKSAIISLKYFSTRIVWENGHSSTTGFGTDKENWRLYRLGGINKGIVREGKDGTIIAPITAVNALGRNIAIKVVTTLCPLSELPENVREHVEDYNYPPPYYWGISSEEQALSELKDIEKLSGMSNPTLDFILPYIKEINKSNYNLHQLLKGRKRVIQDEVAGTMRTIERADRRKSGRLLDRLMKKEEDE